MLETAGESWLAATAPDQSFYWDSINLTSSFPK
jgi:hypothetical protein